MAQIRYFKLSDDIDPGAPLVSFGCAVAVPTMVGDKVKIAPQTITLSDQESPFGQLLSKERTIKTGDPAVINELVINPNYSEVDPPNKPTKKES